jgi:FtsP/CotA-like multicopper oxidase with cupredoxin domain
MAKFLNGLRPKRFRRAFPLQRVQSFPRPLIITIIVAIAAVGGVVAYASIRPSSQIGTTTELSPQQIACSVLNTTKSAPGVANGSSTSSSVSFAIVDSDPGTNYEGMNGSAYHLTTPWPVIQVQQGQTVVITVYNCAPSESHGFAITHYFNSGAAVSAGKSFTFTFVATEAGTFRIYCNIFCAIHPLMQNGELIVTPS